MVPTPVLFSPEEGFILLVLFLFFGLGKFLLWHPQALFLDLAFVQVILGIVVILLIERSPCFGHGLTFPFSSPQILSNRLQVAVVYCTSWICVLLQRKT